MTPLVKDIIMSSTRMPALFLGHGSPMNVLEDNLYTRSWQTLGMTLPRPQAIVVVSAHWFTRGTGVTAMEMPPTTSVDRRDWRRSWACVAAVLMNLL